MNVLVITSLFPTREMPGQGEFVREYCESVSRFAAVSIFHCRDNRKALGQALKLFFLIKNSDRVVIHYGLLVLSAVALAKVVNSKNTIVHLHGSDFLTYESDRLIVKIAKMIYRILLRNMSVVCPSCHFLERVRAISSFSFTTVLPPSYALDVSDLNDKRRRQVQPREARVHFVGREKWEKGGDKISSFAKKLATEPLLISTEFPVDGAETILSQTREEYLRFLSQCDALILCSRTESFCLVAHEALMLKVPILLPRLGIFEAMIGADYPHYYDGSYDDLRLKLGRLLGAPVSHSTYSPIETLPHRPDWDRQIKAILVTE